MNNLLLNILKNQRLGDCKRCCLHETRTNIVFGDGNPNASIMIVGEAPGSDEDIQGKPFVGRSGKLLDQWLEHVGLKRCAVYIANVLKCRPPGNRNPEEDEISTCSSFLKKQIKIINPKAIVALGKFSGQLLSGHNMLSIKDLRSRELFFENIPLIVSYHPSYILRKEGKFDPNGSENSKVISDLKKAIKFDKLNA